MYCGSYLNNSKNVVTGTKANFEAATFPRFEYHLNLIVTIFEHKVNSKEEIMSFLSIFVGGETTSINKEQLLHQLKLQEKKGPGNFFYPLYYFEFIVTTLLC